MNQSGDVNLEVGLDYEVISTAVYYLVPEITKRESGPFMKNGGHTFRDDEPSRVSGQQNEFCLSPSVRKFIRKELIA